MTTFLLPLTILIHLSLTFNYIIVFAMPCISRREGVVIVGFHRNSSHFNISIFQFFCRRDGISKDSIGVFNRSIQVLEH